MKAATAITYMKEKEVPKEDLKQVNETFSVSYRFGSLLIFQMQWRSILINGRSLFFFVLQYSKESLIRIPFSLI